MNITFDCFPYDWLNSAERRVEEPSLLNNLFDLFHISQITEILIRVPRVEAQKSSRPCSCVAINQKLVVTRCSVGCKTPSMSLMGIGTCGRSTQSSHAELDPEDSVFSSKTFRQIARNHSNLIRDFQGFSPPSRPHSYSHFLWFYSFSIWLDAEKNRRILVDKHPMGRRRKLFLVFAILICILGDECEAIRDVCAKMETKWG